MNILLIGGGGREHAIAWRLSQSPLCTRLYCAPGNGGIAQLCECLPVKASDLDGLVAAAREHQIDFAVVAPDDPLADGLVDRFLAAGIPAFGPTAAAARIESSKFYAKELMKRYNIPTARWESFTDRTAAEDYIRAQGAPIVVKADGLALGKGVVVAASLDEALAALPEMLEKSGRVVIEECMTGPEVTVLAFVDGETVRPMPSSRDHKRALDGDRGKNTGGMGAVSPASGYTPEIAAQCLEEIFLPTAQALVAEGHPFRGVLYFGLMLTPQGPRVVEYNARFGDPECQALLMRLQSDLLPILWDTARGELRKADIRWDERPSCCVVMASGGYPEGYPTGFPIAGIPVPTEELYVFHAGTAQKNGQIITSGGRVLGVTALGGTLEAAIDKAYAAVAEISFEGAFFRRDIGKTV